MLHLAGPQDWIELPELPAEARDELREWLDSSQSLLEHQQYMAATDQCLRVLVAAPGFLPAHGGLVRVSLARGDLASARAKLSTLVDVCLLRGRVAEAVEAYQQWLELAPEESARTRLVRLLLDKATAGVAQRLLTAATYLKVNRVEEALGEYQEGVRDFPDSTLAHQCLGRALGWAGRFAEAAAELVVARESAPGDPALLVQLCAAYASGGNQQEGGPSCEQAAHNAFGLLVAALKSEPEQEGGPSCEMKRDGAGLDRALAGYEALPWPRGQVPEVGLWLGLLLLREGRPEAAQPLLRQALDHPGTACLRQAAHLGLGKHYMSVGRLAEALVELQGSQGPAPGQGRGMLPLVEGHLATEGWETGVQILRQLQRLDPEEEALYVKAAETYFKRGRLAESRQDFARLADLYSRRGQVSRAREVQRIMAQMEGGRLRRLGR